ncbi:hypothetical protein RRG08_061221 [Elysia crispata]|uniref:Uncharacterized protein n=1 Tax=Elysia crispata TaxID=231223 RepID=A0AAE0ZI17_9GAST|nr:hypothetical protein RRG08_061221 [Elysia crispata]
MGGSSLLSIGSETDLAQGQARQTWGVPYLTESWFNHSDWPQRHSRLLVTTYTMRRFSAEISGQVVNIYCRTVEVVRDDVTARRRRRRMRPKPKYDNRASTEFID